MSYFTQTGAAYDENAEVKFQQTWTYGVVGCCGPKASNILGITDVISPSRHTQKSSQHVRACATGDGAICAKNRKIVPYHGDSLNSRISARLRSPSPIMAPGYHLFQTKDSKHLVGTSGDNSSALTEFTPLWKTKASNYPLQLKNKNSLYICMQKEQNNSYLHLLL